MPLKGSFKLIVQIVCCIALTKLTQQKFEKKVRLFLEEVNRLSYCFNKCNTSSLYYKEGLFLTCWTPTVLTKKLTY